MGARDEAEARAAAAAAELKDTFALPLAAGLGADLDDRRQQIVDHAPVPGLDLDGDSHARSQRHILAVDVQRRAAQADDRREHQRLLPARRLARETALRPGRAGGPRIFEFDYVFGGEQTVKINDLLQIKALAGELHELAPSVREQVETTLRNIEIPEVRVAVRNSL